MVLTDSFQSLDLQADECDLDTYNIDFVFHSLFMYLPTIPY